jgi:hypothetical protein
VTEPEIQIATGRERRPVAGVDTIIAEMREEFYVEIGGERTLLMRPFARSLRALAEEQARSLGEDLHHAEFVITTSPATVQARGALHDCDACRAGVRRALRTLRENPGTELLVGALYWAGRR